MSEQDLASRILESLARTERLIRESRILRAQQADNEKYGLAPNPNLTDRLKLVSRRLKETRRDMLRLKADMIEMELAKTDPIVPTHTEDL